MKIVLLSALIFACSTSFSQTEIQPYILSKSNQKTNYDKVKTRIFGGLKGLNEGGKYIKYSRKEVASGLTGKKGDYNGITHDQVVFKKLKIQGLMKGTIEDGKRAYEVIIKQGENMIISEFSSTQSVAGESGMVTSNYYKKYYFVKNGEFTILVGVEWITNKFIDDLLATFNNCDNLNEELNEYRDSNAKIFKVFPFIAKIKKCYYTQCYSE